MKLVRFGEAGREKPGLIDADGNIRDLSGYVLDFAGSELDPASLAALARIDPAGLPLAVGNPRIGPCVAGTGKFICIGLNYSDHAAETGATVPPEPIIFMKATSAIVGPERRSWSSRAARKRPTGKSNSASSSAGRRNMSPKPKRSIMSPATASCTTFPSARSRSSAHGQWTKGKSCDTFGPIGPWLVTKDEVPDPQNLPMWLKVNGETMQNGSTKTMVYGVKYLVSYLSQFMSLHPGDIISTGTPPGVGMGMKPPRWLKAGDVVELGIDGLGTQKQNIVAEA